MTTELVLLLVLFVYIVMGSLISPDGGIESTFKKAGPRLGARIERHLETGSGFDGGNWAGPTTPSKRPDSR